MVCCVARRDIGLTRRTLLPSVNVQAIMINLENPAHVFILSLVFLIWAAVSYISGSDDKCPAVVLMEAGILAAVFALAGSMAYLLRLHV